MTFSLQLQPNTKLSIDKIKKTLSDNKIKSVKVSNSELLCYVTSLSLSDTTLILVNNISSKEIIYLGVYNLEEIPTKVQLTIIDSGETKDMNTQQKYNTWQGYCKYLDEKIDVVKIELGNKIDTKIDEVRQEMITKSELKENNKMLLEEVGKMIQTSKTEMMNEITSIIVTEIRNLRN